MRVMMIGPYPRAPDQIDGGVAAAITYLSQALAATSQFDLIGVRVARNEPVRRDWGAFSWPIEDLPYGALGLTTLFRQQRRGLSDLVRKYQPDIVHGQGADVMGYLAIGCGLPSVVTVHGILSEDAKHQSSLRGRVRAAVSGRLIERHTVSRAPELISISPYVTRYYGQLISGRIHNIPNAISPDYFGVRRAVERGRLLFAGRILPRKGVLDLVRAVAQRREAVSSLVLAGNAPSPEYLERVRSEIDELGLTDRVHLPGLLNESSLLEEFSRAEALILPSYQETAPMVVHQAMAAGLAVIATKVGGVPHQIEHNQTGLLVEPGNIAELAEQISRLSADPALSARLGLAAREAALSACHASKVAAATRTAYEMILAPPSSTAPALS